jgi:hypothetical protein
VSDLVRALSAADRLLAGRASELRKRPEWSDVTSRLETSEWRAPDSEHSVVGFWGYVDGDRATLGGVAWIVDLIRAGEQWRVARSVVLNRGTADDQEKVAELPELTIQNSSELAAALPDLVEELLRLPSPEPPAG